MKIDEEYFKSFKNFSFVENIKELPQQPTSNTIYHVRKSCERIVKHFQLQLNSTTFMNNTYIEDKNFNVYFTRCKGVFCCEFCGEIEKSKKNCENCNHMVAHFPRVGVGKYNLCDQKFYIMVQCNVENPEKKVAIVNEHNHEKLPPLNTSLPDREDEIIKKNAIKVSSNSARVDLPINDRTINSQMVSQKKYKKIKNKYGDSSNLTPIVIYLINVKEIIDSFDFELNTNY